MEPVKNKPVLTLQKIYELTFVKKPPIALYNTFRKGSFIIAKIFARQGNKRSSYCKRESMTSISI